MRSDAVPINPVRACAEIDGVLKEDTIVIGDGGDFVGTAANVLKIHKPGHWLDAGPLGTLGAGPGFAMAAKLAKPQSDVIIVYGGRVVWSQWLRVRGDGTAKDQRRRRDRK